MWQMLATGMQGKCRVLIPVNNEFHVVFHGNEYIRHQYHNANVNDICHIKRCQPQESPTIQIWS
jgi:hypothetical protein